MELRKFVRKSLNNCEQAQYLVSLLEKHQHIIRIFHATSLNTVNFQFDTEQLDINNHPLIDFFNEERLKIDSFIRFRYSIVYTLTLRLKSSLSSWTWRTDVLINHIKCMCFIASKASSQSLNWACRVTVQSGIELF